MADVESLKKYYKHATSQINSKLTSKLTMKISCIYCKPHEFELRKTAETSVMNIT